MAHCASLCKLCSRCLYALALHRFWKWMSIPHQSHTYIPLAMCGRSIRSIQCWDGHPTLGMGRASCLASCLLYTRLLICAVVRCPPNGYSFVGPSFRCGCDVLVKVRVGLRLAGIAAILHLPTRLVLVVLPSHSFLFYSTCWTNGLVLMLSAAAPPSLYPSNAWLPSNECKTLLLLLAAGLCLL